MSGAPARPEGRVAVVPVGQLEIARLFDDVYGRTHRWSPPVRLADGEVVGAYLAAAIAGTTFCALDAGGLAGAATLIASPMGTWPAPGYLCWAGVADPAGPDAAATLDALVAHCLDAARRQGRRVEVEVSSNHPELNRCVTSIPGADLFVDLHMMISGPPPDLSS